MADRIVKMAESEISHGHEMEEKTLRAEKDIFRREFVERRTGQWLGFIICFMAIACGTYAAINGAQITASVLCGGSLASLVGAFIYGKKVDNK